MIFITLLGIITSIINMILYYDNDPAFWGWLAATCWASCVLVDSITKRYKY